MRGSLRGRPQTLLLLLLLLLATYRHPFAPAATPTTGCINGAPLTDWPRWLTTHSSTPTNSG